MISLKGTLRTIGWILLIIGWIFYFAEFYLVALGFFFFCFLIFLTLVLDNK